VHSGSPIRFSRRASKFFNSPLCGGVPHLYAPEENQRKKSEPQRGFWGTKPLGGPILNPPRGILGDFFKGPPRNFGGKKKGPLYWL